MAGPPSLMSSGLFAGRYSIERVLGQGATATVHLARDTQRGISVAIKIMRPELAQSKATDRFLKEIRRTAELQHPHILRVLDTGEHEGRPYFVLPYMEGGTLRWKLRGGNQLAFDETVAILRTVAEALDYAHTKGLIHRDVKPENILFTGGQACLGDFGIARALETVYGTDGSTSSNTVRGTYAYMSPEQAAGGMNLDGRSDIYSLACVAYEMITGMQAFIGPTPEAVVAQRFAYTPREVRVYRPSAPLAVDAALATAFAMSPADRYKTATEFVEALSEAATSPSVPTIARRKTPKGSANPLRDNRLVAIGVVAALIAVTAIVSLAVPIIRSQRESRIAIDTTRLAVLPLERDSANAPPWRDDDLLQQGLARWRGVTVVDQYQVVDAVKQAREIRTVTDAANVAKALGAGRFIRGRVSALGDQWQATLSLYETAREAPLYQKSESIPRDISAAVAAYARLADSLLLRGAAADSVPTGATGTRSLSAVQAFTKAQRALDDWDLAGADSGFLAATTYDPDYARASLWLAQVRAWQGLPPNSWGTVAERSAAISDQLNDRERRLVQALVFLAKGTYGSACAMYDSLRVKNDKDFAAWFGLGQCRRMNKAVVADPKSPSGWSFQSSAREWIGAYTSAFEILPSVHRGYERGAFGRLRVLMLLGSELYGGVGADSAVFYARPAWLDDTLALVPYPWQRVFSEARETYPPGYDKARASLQSNFARIASGWSSAFPLSAGAKEAVSISLEIAGDIAAIDTIRLARRLALDSIKATQLAVYEVLLLARFGIDGDVALLQRARALSDSLLDSSVSPTPGEAQDLASAAALTGRCAKAEALTRQGTLPPAAGISPQLVSRSLSLLPHLAIGCYRTASPTAVKELFLAIGGGTGASRPQERRRVGMILMYRPALLSPELDPLVIDSLAAWSTDSLLIAAASLGHADTAKAKTALAAVFRAALPGPLTPDIALARALVALRLRDSTLAARVLDYSLSTVRSYDVNTLADVATAASLVHAALLRSELALAARDSTTARRWGLAAGALWKNADSEPRDRLTRLMQSLRIAH